MTEIRFPRFVWAGLACCVLLAGCTWMDQKYGRLPTYEYRSPVFETTAPATVRAPVNVEIQNGAGQYLYAGPAGRIATNPDLANFDGTLKITTLWNTGETTVQTLSSPSGRRVDIGWDNTKKEYYLNPTGVPSGQPWIVLQDEKGFVYYSGPQNSLRQYFVEPAYRDGKLIITTYSADAPPVRQELTYTKNQLYPGWDWWPELDINWDTAQNRYVVSDPASENTRPTIAGLDIGAGWGRFKDRGPSTGVVVGTGTPLLKGPGRLDFGSVDVDFPVARYKNWGIKVGVGARWGSESTDGTFSGASNGWAYQGGENGGSGGVSAGAPSSSHIGAEYDWQQLRAIVSRLAPYFAQSDPSRISEDYVLTLGRNQRRYDSSVIFPVIGGVSSNDSQKITGYDVGLWYGLSGRHDFGNRLAFVGEGRLGAIGHWADYDGVHRYLCSFCTAANQNFTQSTGYNRCGLTLGAYTRGAFEYSLSRDTRISFGGDYYYQGSGSFLQNRVVPTDQAPHLYGASFNSWSVNANLITRFGPR